MSLTAADLQAIKTVVIDGINEAIEVLILPRFEALEAKVALLCQAIEQLNLQVTSLENRVSALEHSGSILELRMSSLEATIESIDGRLQAVENDITEIYQMLKQSPRHAFGVSNYSRLTNSQKLDVLSREIVRLQADFKPTERQ